MSQWVWNTRLALGVVSQGQAIRRTRWPATPAAPPISPAGPPPEAQASGQPHAAALVEGYGALEVARDWGRASGRFAGHAFAVLEDGTLRCPAGTILRPQERRTEANGATRIVYRAKREACRVCALARECLGPQASGEQPRRVSAVRKRIARPGGMRAALLHEEATPEERPSAQHKLLWLDLPAYRIRREYVTQLRRRMVMIVAARGDRAPAGASGTPRTWTRAERAHRRLSWGARLARNRRDAVGTGYRFMVFGIMPALAACLGIPADPPG